MARPKKYNADYFTHDADMRNDPKVKALRRKYGIEGYAIWNMMLEVLTDSDYFEYEWTELNIELLAGDFDIEPEFLKEVIEYCCLLKLLKNEADLIFSEKMKERFETLLNKRNRDLKRKKEEFSERKTPNKKVIQTESTQSKVKESKVKEIKDIYTEKNFLKRWEDARMYYDKKPTNIRKLKHHCNSKFQELIQDYDESDFDVAIKGLFQQETYPQTRIQPDHFLENFEQYLTCGQTGEKLFENKNKKQLQKGMI